MDVMAGDGVRLRVEPGTSNRPPLVLSNSLGTDVSLWDAQVPVFELQASVWRYDTRGHGRSGVPASETTIELNYRLQPTPFMSLMPNVQYVIHPNGLSSIGNALVLGLQARVTF
mgnify:CR=1 FL=1